ncbi:MAG: 3'-5' exonuclease [Erysipelotrichaceae bacterium]|nr:3'-5' exonuclease [Erysipelotrichaceae bacterium]
MAAKVIFYDIETTGLSWYNDEILQLSIIDIEGNELFSHYIRPIKHLSWPGAYRVNHIGWEMVEDCLAFADFKQEIQEIFDEAEMIVGYNNRYFDNRFLEHAGIRIDKEKSFDLMRYANKEYGRISLVNLAKRLGYVNTENAHEASFDAHLTRYCYLKLIRP